MKCVYGTGIKDSRLTQFRMLMSDYEVTLVNDNSEYSDTITRWLHTNISFYSVRY